MFVPVSAKKRVGSSTVMMTFPSTTPLALISEAFKGNGAITSVLMLEVLTPGFGDAPPFWTRANCVRAGAAFTGCGVAVDILVGASGAMVWVLFVDETSPEEVELEVFVAAPGISVVVLLEVDLFVEASNVPTEVV